MTVGGDHYLVNAKILFFMGKTMQIKEGKTTQIVY
jgi:hypothetical protein